MISSCETRHGPTYCLFSITIGSNGCLQISNPHNPPNQFAENIIKTIIPHNGTLLFVINNPFIDSSKLWMCLSLLGVIGGLLLLCPKVDLSIPKIK